MAKIAYVGYGHDGRGTGTTENGYAYVVNDNVRTKQVIQVVATSSAQRKFATTGMVRNAYGENTAKGKMAKASSPSELTKAYTGKEVDASGSKAPVGGKTAWSEYSQSVRGGNLAAYKAEHPEAKLTENAQETFESYSRKFIGKGDNGNE